VSAEHEVIVVAYYWKDGDRQYFIPGRGRRVPRAALVMKHTSLHSGLTSVALKWFRQLGVSVPRSGGMAFYFRAFTVTLYTLDPESRQQLMQRRGASDREWCTPSDFDGRCEPDLAALLHRVHEDLEAY
jgi:hypothetical protein